MARYGGEIEDIGDSADAIEAARRQVQGLESDVGDLETKAAALRGTLSKVQREALAAIQAAEGQFTNITRQTQAALERKGLLRDTGLAGGSRTALQIFPSASELTPLAQAVVRSAETTQRRVTEAARKGAQERAQIAQQALRVVEVTAPRGGRSTFEVRDQENRKVIGSLRSWGEAERAMQQHLERTAKSADRATESQRRLRMTVEDTGRKTGRFLHRVYGFDDEVIGERRSDTRYAAARVRRSGGATGTPSVIGYTNAPRRGGGEIIVRGEDIERAVRDGAREGAAEGTARRQPGAAPPGDRWQDWVEERPRRVDQISASADPADRAMQEYIRARERADAIMYARRSREALGGRGLALELRDTLRRQFEDLTTRFDIAEGEISARGERDARQDVKDSLARVEAAGRQLRLGGVSEIPRFARGGASTPEIESATGRKMLSDLIERGSVRLLPQFAESLGLAGDELRKATRELQSGAREQKEAAREQKQAAKTPPPPPPPPPPPTAQPPADDEPDRPRDPRDMTPIQRADEEKRLRAVAEATRAAQREAEAAARQAEGRQKAARTRLEKAGGHPGAAYLPDQAARDPRIAKAVASFERAEEAAKAQREAAEQARAANAEAHRAHAEFSSLVRDLRREQVQGTEAVQRTVTPPVVTGGAEKPPEAFAGRYNQPGAVEDFTQQADQIERARNVLAGIADEEAEATSEAERRRQVAEEEARLRRDAEAAERELADQTERRARAADEVVAAATRQRQIQGAQQYDQPIGPERRPEIDADGEAAAIRAAEEAREREIAAIEREIDAANAATRAHAELPQATGSLADAEKEHALAQAAAKRSAGRLAEAQGRLNSVLESGDRVRIGQAQAQLQRAQERQAEASKRITNATNNLNAHYAALGAAVQLEANARRVAAVASAVGTVGYDRRQIGPYRSTGAVPVPIGGPQFDPRVADAMRTLAGSMDRFVRRGQLPPGAPPPLALPPGIRYPLVPLPEGRYPEVPPRPPGTDIIPHPTEFGRRPPPRGPYVQFRRGAFVGEEDTAARRHTPQMDEYNQRVREAEDSLRGYAAAQRDAEAGTRAAGVQIGTASQAMHRHGAVTSEFILAAARGEVTMRELGFQTAVTIGKFAAWTAAAGAVYGVLGAVRELGQGVIETQGGIQQMSRVIDNVDSRTAGQALRSLSEEFNVPIDVAADAVYRMGQRFHDQAEAVEAARSALYSFKVGEVDVATSTKNLIAITTGAGLSASQLTQVFNQINEAQNRFGIGIADTEAGLAKAIGTWTAAGGTIDSLIPLFVAIGRATNRSGQEIGTGIARVQNFLRQPKQVAQLREQGIEADPYDIEGTFQQALQAARRPGADVYAIASGLFGPQYARLFTAVLQDTTTLDQATQDLARSNKDVQDSAPRELEKVLREAREQLSAVANEMQQLGSALYEIGAFDVFGLMLRGINLALGAATDLVEIFAKLPSPIREGLVYMAQLAALMAGLRRFGVTGGLAQKYPQLAPLDRPENRLQALGIRGLRDQADELTNYREAQERAAFRYAADVESYRTRLTDIDRETALNTARMAHPRVVGTLEADDLAERNAALAQERAVIQARFEASEKAMNESRAKAVSATRMASRAEDELRTMRGLSAREAVKWMAMSGMPLPPGFDSPDARGARMMNWDDILRNMGPEPEPGRNARRRWTATALTAAQLRVSQFMPRMDFREQYGPGGRFGNIGQTPAARNLQQALDRATTRLSSSGLFLGNTGRAMSRLADVGFAAATRGSRAISGAGPRLRQMTNRMGGMISNFARSIGLLDGLILAFIGYQIIEDKLAASQDKIDRENKRLGRRPQRESGFQERLKRLDEIAQSAGDTFQAGDIPRQLWNMVAWPFSERARRNYNVAGTRVARGREAAFLAAQMRADMDNAAREREEGVAVHHTLSSEILSYANTQADQARAGVLSLGEFNAEIDERIREVYQSRYINKPKLRRRTREDLRGVQREVARQLAPEDLTTRYQGLDAEGLQAEQEVTARLLTQPGRRGQRQRLEELESLGMRIRTALRGGYGGEYINALLDARDRAYSAIEQAAREDMDEGLKAATTESQRRAVFRRARRDIRAPLQGLRGRRNQLREAIRADQEEIGQIAQQLNRLEAAGVGIPSAFNQLTGTVDVRAQSGASNLGRMRGDIDRITARMNAKKARVEELTEEINAYLDKFGLTLREFADLEFEDVNEGIRLGAELRASGLDPDDTTGRARENQNAARRIYRRNLRRFGGGDRRTRQALIDLNNARNETVSAVTEDMVGDIEAVNALERARAGSDPVRQARAGVNGARRTYNALRRRGASRNRIREALAGVIEAETQLSETIADRAAALAQLGFDLQSARAHNDAMAQVRIGQRAAQDALSRARTPEERAQALLGVQEANNAAEDALWDREAARFEWLASRTADPVRQARFRRMASGRERRRYGRGTAEWYRADAQFREDRRAEREEEYNARRDDIEFGLDMERITTDTAITMYKRMLKTHGITKQLRRDILRRIKELQNEGSDAFELNVGDIPLPTVYEIRRAAGGGGVAPANATTIVQAPTTINVNGDGNPEVTARRVVNILGRSYTTATRASARAGLRR